MTLTVIPLKKTQDFFKAIEPLQPAYADPSFTYLAIRGTGGWELIKGRVAFNTGPSNLPLTHFESKNVRAGHYLFAELKTTPRDFLHNITNGPVKMPFGNLTFPMNQHGYHDASYQPFHEQGLLAQNRLEVLSITGANNPVIGHAIHYDWEVRASDTPYDGLQELMTEYNLGPLENYITLEFVAYNVAAFDFSSSVDGTTAHMVVRLAVKADTDQFKLGYRVSSQGKIQSRGMLPGDAFRWTDRGGYKEGTSDLEVPNAAVIHCIANYAGIAEHHGWMLDPNVVQNPQRAVYETFDRKLEFALEVLGREPKGSRARDLETVCGWIFWMLGFSVANLGGTDRTQEAADLLVTTPAGHMAIVEVTMGLLKAENKLANLHDRAQAVRKSLDNSNNKHIRLLPIIITTKTREEIQPDLEQAEKWGIFSAGP